METIANQMEVATLMESNLFMQDRAKKARTLSEVETQSLTEDTTQDFCDSSFDSVVEPIETTDFPRDEVFPLLVDRCWQRAYWIAFDLLGNAAEAEDLCQDALLRAYEKWGSFRNESSIDTWFFRILTNLSLNRKRRHGIWSRVRQWIQAEQEQDVEPMNFPSFACPEKQLRSREIGEAVQSAMEHLSTQQRTIFVLRYLQHFSLKEISEITELAEGTIKTHIFRALKTMRRHLEHAR